MISLSSLPSDAFRWFDDRLLEIYKRPSWRFQRLVRSSPKEGVTYGKAISTLISPLGNESWPISLWKSWDCGPGRTIGSYFSWSLWYRCPYRASSHTEDEILYTAVYKKLLMQLIDWPWNQLEEPCWGLSISVKMESRWIKRLMLSLKELSAAIKDIQIPLH